MGIIIKKKSRLMLIFYTLLVIFIAAIQFGLFVHGESFARSFLHIDFNPADWDSIFYGSFIYFIAYLFAMPRNPFVKYV